jgi:hypothetical protein
MTPHPRDEVEEAVLATRDELVALVLRAEKEIGGWEDDGGATAPEHVHRTFGLVAPEVGLL